MPRLLLISFHYRPLGAVASERARAWAECLARQGWNVDVLTHYWEKVEGQWTIPNIPTKIETPEERLRIIRLGASPPEELHLNSKRRKFAILKNWLAGHFDPLAWTVPAHEAMEDWCNEHVGKGSYDISLGIFSPHTHLKLCFDLHQRTGIPYHLDFRDLWDNFLVKEAYKPAGIHRIKHILILMYWRKWLKNCSGMSAVSSSLTDYLQSQFKVHCETILTGFDASRLPESKKKSSTFAILYSGSLYNHQHYDLAVAGLKIFFESHPQENITVNFQGIFRQVPEEGLASYSSQAAEYIKSELNDKRVKTGGRIPVEEVRQMQEDAQVLIMPTHKGVPGIIPGKFQEYLGSGTRILAIPRDEKGIAEILDNSGAGICVEEVEEFADTLKLWYAEWQENGALQSLAPLQKRMVYSQKSQAELLSKMLEAELK